MPDNDSAHDATDDTRPAGGDGSVPASASARERGGRRGLGRPFAVVVAGLALAAVTALGAWAVLNASGAQPTAAPSGTSVPGVSTAAPDALAASTRVEDPAEAVSLLYSLSATAGTLTRIAGSDDEYALVLSDTDKQVLWFADQPSRKAGVMPTGGFASEWAGFGFAADPPNVAVVLHDVGPEADTVVAEMQAPTFDAASGTFTATVRILEETEQDGLSGKLSQHATNADAALPEAFDGVSLFIDDVAGTVVNGCLIQPYTVCEGADLAGAKLSGVNLTGADLTGADLSGADLSGANLAGADFTGANLTGANLLGATLTGTIFTGATMTGAQLSAAPPTVPSINYPFCSGASTGSLVLADGVVATSFSAPNNGGRGTVTLVGPDGLSLDATFLCTNRTAAANTAARSGSWSLTVTGSHGAFSSPVAGLTVQNGSVTGTIVRNNSVLTWSVAAVATLAVNGVSATGQLAITGPHTWSVSVIGAGGQFTDPDSGTLRPSSASGTIADASGAVSGTVHLGLAGQHKFVQALPAAWAKSAAVDLSFAKKAGSSVPMTRSVVLSVGASSGADSLSLSGPWTPDGYSLTGTGTLQLNGTTVAVTGSYGSTGSQDASGTTLTSPQWNVKGQFSGVSLGGGATITSGSIGVSSDTPGIV